MTIEASLLDPGERCIWSGTPNAGWFAFRRLYSHNFAAFAFFAVPIFLVTTLIALLARFANPGARGQAYPALDPFFIVLAFFCLAAFGWLRLSGARTKYLLTNRRLIIDTLGPLAKRISVPLEHVRYVELRSRLTSPGDVIFLQTGPGTFPFWGFKDDGFIAIADATQVERLLREAIDQTFSTRSRGPSQ